MNLNYNMVKVYDWEDIEDEICKRVGVDGLGGRYVNNETGEEVSANFDGGEYRNFWHQALETFIPDNMTNDSTVTLAGMEDWEDNKEWYLDMYGDWTEPYFQAYNDIMKELDPDYDGIEVRFSW